jgi:hypothetical protein
MHFAALWEKNRLISHKGTKTTKKYFDTYGVYVTDNLIYITNKPHSKH